MFSKILLTGLLAISSLSSFAESVKDARINDVASKYILEDDGDFFRIVKGNKCQITSNVTEFKVSGHKFDNAMVYFKKAGNLHYLKNAAAPQGNCPKTQQGVLLSGVKKFTVVANNGPGAMIVNMGLDQSGRFVAWDNSKAVVQLNNIVDYVNNSCFGKEGASYSSYTAFAINSQGMIYKIKGGEAEVKADQYAWKNIGDFKDYYKVCQ